MSTWTFFRKSDYPFSDITLEDVFINLAHYKCLILHATTITFVDEVFTTLHLCIITGADEMQTYPSLCVALYIGQIELVADYEYLYSRFACPPI